MATEILSVPEEHLRDVIRVIRTGLEADDLGEIAPVVREQLTKWCDSELAYITRVAPLPTVPVWHVLHPDRRHHLLVAATTMAAAARLLGVPYHWMRGHSSMTANVHDIRRATTNPGAVWKIPCGADREWQLVKSAPPGK